MRIPLVYALLAALLLAACARPPIETGNAAASMRRYVSLSERVRFPLPAAKVQPVLRALRDDRALADTSFSVTPTYRATSAVDMTHAYALAMADARSKAETIASKAGTALGPVLRVQDVTPVPGAGTGKLGTLTSADITLSVDYGGRTPITTLGSARRPWGGDDPKDQNGVTVDVTIGGFDGVAVQRGLDAARSEIYKVAQGYGVDPASITIDTTGRSVSR